MTHKAKFQINELFTIYFWQTKKWELSQKVGNIKCRLGLHKYSWKYDGSPIILKSEPPSHAKCKRCGEKYEA